MEGNTKNKFTKMDKYVKSMGTTSPNGSFRTEVTRKSALDSGKVEEIINMSMGEINKDRWMEYSMLYSSVPAYSLLLEYYSNLLPNYYYVTPIGNQTSENVDKVLDVLDEDLEVERFTSEVIYNMLVKGEVFYALAKRKYKGESRYKLMTLPNKACEIVGNAGTPGVNIVSFDLSVIDEEFRSLDRELQYESEDFIKQYPDFIQKAYLSYKGSGQGEKRGPKVVILPLDVGVGFSTRNGMPPFAFLLKQLARVMSLENLRDDYLESTLSKLLVQKIKVDKDGNPEQDLHLAAEFHRNLLEVAKQKGNVDALTTIADIEVLSLGESGERKNNHDFMKSFYEEYYSGAGVSQELVNSTSAGTLEKSMGKDEAYVMSLRGQVQAWLNLFTSKVASDYGIQDTKFVVSYLEVSYRDREKKIDGLLKLAQYGYSKLLPIVASGVKQRYVRSLLKYEKDELDLLELLIPLESSHTGGSTDSDPEGGRPSKDVEEKEDGTIEKESTFKKVLKTLGKEDA